MKVNEMLMGGRGEVWGERKKKSARVYNGINILLLEIEKLKLT